jgi:hypothetical protein
MLKADDRLRKSEQDGNAAIVKAAPKLRQHFCLFLGVDRDRAEGNLGLSPIAEHYHLRSAISNSKTCGPSW